MCADSTDITLAYAAGSGRFEQMSVHLARSIDHNTSCDSVVFIPESEAEDVSDAGLRELRELSSDVVVEETTIPEYGQSAKLDAFAAAAEQHSPPYVLLDTDTLLLDEFNIDLNAADVFAKPVDMGAQYWGSPASIPDWKQLYDEHGFEFPNERTRSTVDNREILPYYNAGVVGTSRQEFPRRWLELTKPVYEEIDQAFFTDQVSLAMLMSDYTHRDLSERENYPASVRVRFPSDISVLHYHNWDTLYRVRGAGHRQRLAEIGIVNQLQSPPRVQQLKEVAKSARRVAKYRVVRQVMQAIKDARTAQV